ncbi:MAG TPA: MarR family transcriptional regulator [Methanoregulaceae archaeon]|nr:MarR family transcriptional regulator [Methanoregulaceae archaeon]
MRGDPRPQNAGRERGPPALPAAAPVRTGLEPLSQGPGESGGGRGRRDLPALPSTAETNDGVPDPLLLLRFLLFLGYRRIRPGNVLDHPMRRDLASAIMADPGLDLAGCVAVTGANRETLRYHLALLVCAGKVMEETRNGSVRYFPHDPTLTSSHRAVLHLDRNPSLAPLLHHIRDEPGISRKDLAERLGVAGPSVNRQVQRLVDEGLVERRRCGQSQRYWLTPDAARAFATIAMAEAPHDGVIQTRDRASA